MLKRFPALKMPTVRTEGSVVTLTCRLWIVCSARTICDAITIGSTPSQGRAPCVCRPLTVIRNVSDPALRWPARHAEDAGARERWRRAGRRWPPAADCRMLPPRSSGALRPPRGRHAFLGGLEDELHRAGQVAAHAGEHLGGAPSASPRGRRGRRRASRRPSGRSTSCVAFDAKGRSTSSATGRASTMRSRVASLGGLRAAVNPTSAASRQAMRAVRDPTGGFIASPPEPAVALSYMSPGRV